MAGRALKIDYKKSDSTNQPNESTERNTSETVNEDANAGLAYQLWRERGCPSGSDQRGLVSKLNKDYETGLEQFQQQHNCHVNRHLFRSRSLPLSNSCPPSCDRRERTGKKDCGGYFGHSITESNQKQF